MLLLRRCRPLKEACGGAVRRCMGEGEKDFGVRVFNNVVWNGLAAYCTRKKGSDRFISGWTRENDCEKGGRKGGDET